MAILNILQEPHPILLQVSSYVLPHEFDDNTELKGYIRDMEDTLASSGGIGLAAPQIGILKRIAILHLVDESGLTQIKTLINPVAITTRDDDQKIDSIEGCLSVPDRKSYSIPRFASVRVEYQDVDGMSHFFYASGIQAICIQHEIDHLDGILISRWGET